MKIHKSYHYSLTGDRREGQRVDRERDQGQRAAGPRRRRVPVGAQVELHEQAGRREAQVPRGQRRRGRARHVQGQGDHEARPPQAGELKRCGF